MAEKTFTLEQAKRELDLQECLYHGHDWIPITTFGTQTPTSFVCSRCGLVVEVVVKRG